MISLPTVLKRFDGMMFPGNWSRMYCGLVALLACVGSKFGLTRVVSGS